MSRMVVLPERLLVWPFNDQEVDGTCQKPCELQDQVRTIHRMMRYDGTSLVDRCVRDLIVGNRGVDET